MSFSDDQPTSNLRRARVRHVAALVGFVWFCISILIPRTNQRGLRTRALRGMVRVRRRVRQLRRSE